MIFDNMDDKKQNKTHLEKARNRCGYMQRKNGGEEMLPELLSCFIPGEEYDCLSNNYRMG